MWRELVDVDLEGIGNGGFVDGLAVGGDQHLEEPLHLRGNGDALAVDVDDSLIQACQ